jgi:hypothetical protein
VVYRAYITAGMTRARAQPVTVEGEFRQLLVLRAIFSLSIRSYIHR